MKYVKTKKYFKGKILRQTCSTGYFILKTKAVAQSCSVKKAFLRNFPKFTGKHLCQSLLFNKVASLKPAALLKKRFWHRCFPVNFAKFLRTPFFKEDL